MQFRILGSLEVLGSAGSIAVGGAKRRGVLAYFLVHRGSLLSAERIAGEMWEQNDDRGIATVQTYVSQLRKLMASETDIALRTRPAGYVLELPDDALDASRFETLSRAANGELSARQRVAQLDTALALWRGAALEEFSWPWANAERARLEQLRIDALCRRIDARLELGEHADVLSDLELLTRQYPLDERFWRLGMLAAYRAGRQGDALRAFQRARRHLAEELGVDPGPELVELERRILEHDPSLLPPESASRVRTASAHSSLPTGVVTFVLTDVIGSTSSWERHPRAMDAALARHDRVVADAVNEANGTVLKARGEGDSTFSVFARATDAVLAAVALQRALLEEEWPAPIQLQVRAAVHTGEAVERDGDYFGPTVNRAARLRGLAEGGEVVVSHSVWEVARHHLPPELTFVDLGERRLKGSDVPERAYIVRSDVKTAAAEASVSGIITNRVSPLPGFLALDEATFVGRDRELALLHDAWNRAREGTRQIVFVAGEPGIGKTALVAKFTRGARETSAVVLGGRCDEGYDVPYQPFVEALGELLSYPVASTATRLEARLGGELVRILPDAPQVLNGLPLPIETDPETARYRLFEAVASWLAAVVDETPVILVLDDLHWATFPTLLMLRHLARHPATRLLVVATYRQTEVPLASSFASVLAELERDENFQTVRLSGLGERDVEQLLERTGSRAGHMLPSSSEIHTRTGGNALFVRELLRSLAEADEWPSGPPRLSPRLRDVIVQRVGRLSSKCRKLLEVAAIFGSEFTLQGLDDIDASLPTTEEVLETLDEAIDAALIAEVRSRMGTYRFVHAVVREAVEATLSTSRRLQLHLAVARALEKTPGETKLAQLSYHFCAALPLATEADAVRYAREAGDYALSVLAFEEAVDHYARALDAASQSGTRPTLDRCELMLRLADAQARAGDVGAAADALDQAAEMARILDLPEHFARAALCFEGELVTGGPEWERRRALLEEAYERLDGVDDLLRVRVVAMLAYVRAAISYRRGVDELSHEAVEMASRLGNDLGLAAALLARHQALAMPAHAHERAELAARVVALGETAAATSWTMLGRHTRLADLLDLGDLDAFDREFETYEHVAHELRRPHDLWRADVMRAMRALFGGRLEEGEAIARRAYEIGTQSQQPGALQSYVIQTFFLAWQRSGLGDLLPSAAEWAQSNASAPGWRAALAVSYAEAGRADDAALELARLTRDDFAAVPQDNLWLATMCLCAHACWRIDDIATAVMLRSRIAPYANRNVTIGTALALGAAGRSLGQLDAMRGDLDSAVVILERAVAANERMGSALWTHHARRDLIDVLHRRALPADLARAEEELARPGETTVAP